jgi:hypothetical protein
MHGASHLPGVPLDVQGRLGMGNLIPGTSFLKDSADKTREFTEVFGAAGAFAKGAYDAGEALLRLDPAAAAKAVAPVAIQNLMKAWEMWNTGVYKNAKGQRVMDVTPGDAISKAFGFQPQDVALDSRQRSEVQQGISMHKATESRLAAKIAEGRYELTTAHNGTQIADAQEKIKNAREEVKRWNDRNPEDRIVIAETQIIERVRDMRRLASERMAKRAPKEMRERVREELK